MARLIDAAHNTVLSYPRLVRIRGNGKPMEVVVRPNADEPGSAPRTLWVRFATFDSEPETTVTALSFTGFLSDSYAALEEKSFDALDPDRTQLVRGSIDVPMGTGQIRPDPS
ncbi:MAG: hypothetical protein WCO25_05005 [Candidatus Uhrbacteria bacterium]